jgi:hypothetical protein
MLMFRFSFLDRFDDFFNFRVSARSTINNSNNSNNAISANSRKDIKESIDNNVTIEESDEIKQDNLCMFINILYILQVSLNVCEIFSLFFCSQGTGSS